MQKLRGFSRTQRVVLAAFVLVLAFTGFYSYRTYQSAVFWQEHRDEPIAGWMRVGFVAASYQVPRSELNRAVGLPPNVRDRRPLSEIAEDQGRPFEEVKADLERAISDLRTKRPPPGGQP
jgi:hypothetical protein